MATLKEQTDKIYGIKQDIKQSLIGKGYTEEEVTNMLASYPSLISRLDVVKFPQWFKDSLVCWYDPKKQGLTNEKIIAERDAKGYFTLKDFSPIPKAVDPNTQLPIHEHLDMRCYGFAGEGMSGTDGYAYIFDNIKAVTIKEKTSSKLRFTPKKLVNNFFISYVTTSIERFKVHINGTIDPLHFSLKYQYTDSNDKYKTIEFDKEGVYELPKCINSNKKWVGFVINDWDTITPFDITIEILPLYPDALVFDGVDDYGISENQPKLSDYTVIAKRKWIKGNIAGCLASKNLQGAFTFEGSGYANSTWSFGFANGIGISNTINVTYQNKNNYNGISINYGTNEDNEELTLGKFGEDSRYGKFALYQFLLFNRTLTLDEIQWVKTNIMGGEELPEQLTEGKEVTNGNN